MINKTKICTAILITAIIVIGGGCFEKNQDIDPNLEKSVSRGIIGKF